MESPTTSKALGLISGLSSSQSPVFSSKPSRSSSLGEGKKGAQFGSWSSKIPLLSLSTPSVQLEESSSKKRAFDGAKSKLHAPNTKGARYRKCCFVCIDGLKPSWMLRAQSAKNK